MKILWKIEDWLDKVNRKWADAFYRHFIARHVGMLVALVILLTLAGCGGHQALTSRAQDSTTYLRGDPNWRAAIQAQAGPPVSSSIFVDRPETYPPMPVGTFLYVDIYAQRQHFQVVKTIASITFASSSRLIIKTPVATVILFTDGTGLILTDTAEPVIKSGPVTVHYSIPPAATPSQPTVVLIHGLTKTGG